MPMDMAHAYDRQRSRPEYPGGAASRDEAWGCAYTALTHVRTLRAHWEAPLPDRALTRDEWELLVGSEATPTTEGQTDDERPREVGRHDQPLDRAGNGARLAAS